MSLMENYFLRFSKWKITFLRIKKIKILGCFTSVCERKSLSTLSLVRQVLVEFFAAAQEGFTEVSFLQPVFRGKFVDVEYGRLETCIRTNAIL